MVLLKKCVTGWERGDDVDFPGFFFGLAVSKKIELEASYLNEGPQVELKLNIIFDWLYMNLDGVVK